MDHDSVDKKNEPLLGTRVRLLTWNILWRFDRWRARAPVILETLKAVDADILALQEVWDDGEANQAAHLSGELSLHYTYEPVSLIDGATFGMAILAKWPIARREAIALPSVRSSDGGRDCRVMFAEVEGPHGPIGVFCTHLSWRPEESQIRQEQVRALTQFVADIGSQGFPPVVCGDFNAIPTSDEIRMMTGETACPVPGLVFYDAWVAGGDGSPGITWHNENALAARSLRPDRRLDYVFVGEPQDGGAGHVVKAELVGAMPTDSLCPSDHYGVLVTMRY